MNCYLTQDVCKSELGKKLQYWRAERPDEWTMDDCIRQAEAMHDEMRKLRSMCKAAAAEISDHWQAHCDKDGYGPVNLISRLEGRLPPDLYPGYDT